MERIEEKYTFFLKKFIVQCRQGENWPPRLLMQLMPKQLVGSIGQQYLKESRSVGFHLSPVRY